MERSDKQKMIARSVANAMPLNDGKIGKKDNWRIAFCRKHENNVKKGVDWFQESEDRSALFDYCGVDTIHGRANVIFNSGYYLRSIDLIESGFEKIVVNGHHQLIMVYGVDHSFVYGFKD
jgi:hypothetical protein